MTGKQGTRGQKQIYEENQSTIRFYSLMAVISSVAVILLDTFLFETTIFVWVSWTLTSLTQLGTILMMIYMTKSIKANNKVVDAGMDLNDPAAFGEYCKDVLILSSIAHGLSLIWTKFYLLLLIIPAFALFKLWTGILAPWFFAAPEETETSDDKNKKKREKRVYLKR